MCRKLAFADSATQRNTGSLPTRSGDHLLPRRRLVPSPIRIDDEYLSCTDDEGIQPPDKPSRLEYFILSIGLLDIGDNAELLQQAHVSQGRKTYSSIELGTVVSISADLDTFLRELPNHLRRGKAAEPVFELQSNIIHARVMYIRLWILRPFLLAEVKSQLSKLGRCRRKTPPRQLRVSRTNSGTTNAGSAWRQLTMFCRSCIGLSPAYSGHRPGTHYSVSLAARPPFLRPSFPCRMSRNVCTNRLALSPQIPSRPHRYLLRATLCPQLGVDLEQDPARRSWDRVIQLFRFQQHTYTLG